MNNPDDFFSTLLPQTPYFIHEKEPGNSSLWMFDLSIYVITKNKKTQQLNSYNAITEMKVDKVQVDRAKIDNDTGDLYILWYKNN